MSTGHVNSIHKQHLSVFDVNIFLHNILYRMYVLFYIYTYIYMYNAHSNTSFTSKTLFTYSIWFYGCAFSPVLYLKSPFWHIILQINLNYSALKSIVHIIEVFSVLVFCFLPILHTMSALYNVDIYRKCV